MKKDKKELFKDSLKIVAGFGVPTVALVAGVVATKDNTTHSLEKFNINNNALEEFVNENENHIVEHRELLKNLEESVRVYSMLSEGALTDTQKDELSTAKEDIKSIIASSELSKIYRDDLLKEKLSDIYDIDSSKIEIKAPYEMGEYNYWIKIDGMDPIYKQSMCEPVKLAIEDIITLQSLEEKESIKDKDIDKVVGLYKNMKGFANLTFIKGDDGKIAYFELNELDKAKEKSDEGR